MSPAQMIAGVENGIYIIGDGSFSIDQQRYNAQFGGQLFYEIKNGKITQPLEDVAAPLRQHLFDTGHFHEIDAHSDDAHRVTNTRRRDTRPSSSSTTRYAPLAIRCAPAVRSQAYSTVPAGSVVEINRSPVNV